LRARRSRRRAAGRSRRAATGRSGGPAAATALPADVHADSLSRLPLRTRDEMDDPGKRFYDAVVGPQSRTLVGLQGPSGISLHAPRLGELQRAVNQYLRFDTALGRRLTELAILVAARELDSQFEWTAHEPAALIEGLEQKIIDVVKRRRPVTGLSAKEAAIVGLGREVFRRRKVQPQTFARAVELLGRQGVVELVALMGNYAATALMFRAVDQQLHPGRKPLLPIPR
jgi:4-carboxymuconolactone decarboxylase